MNNGNLLSDINEHFTSLTRRSDRLCKSPAAARILSMESSPGYRNEEKQEGYIQSEYEIIIRYLLLNYSKESYVILSIITRNEISHNEILEAT